MKKLKVDVEETALIMENEDRFGNHYYLDTETGETLSIPDEIMSALEEGESCEGLPAWELELLSQAKQIFEGSGRYEEIPTRFGDEAYRLMVKFAGRMTDSTLREKLRYALDGRGAFRRFKDALREYPEIEEQCSNSKPNEIKKKLEIGWKA